MRTSVISCNIKVYTTQLRIARIIVNSLVVQYQCFESLRTSFVTTLASSRCVELWVQLGFRRLSDFTQRLNNKKQQTLIQIHGSLRPRNITKYKHRSYREEPNKDHVLYSLIMLRSPEFFRLPQTPSIKIQFAWMTRVNQRHHKNGGDFPLTRHVLSREEEISLSNSANGRGCPRDRLCWFITVIDDDMFTGN